MCQGESVVLVPSLPHFYLSVFVPFSNREPLHSCRCANFRTLWLLAFLPHARRASTASSAVSHTSGAWSDKLSGGGPFGLAGVSPLYDFSRRKIARLQFPNNVRASSEVASAILKGRARNDRSYNVVSSRTQVARFAPTDNDQRIPRGRTSIFLRAASA